MNTISPASVTNSPATHAADALEYLLYVQPG
jgi:hypothetical protein